MIFLDAWAWIALADKSDPYYRKAKAMHKKLTGHGGITSPPITSWAKRSPTCTML